MRAFALLTLLTLYSQNSYAEVADKIATPGSVLIMLSSLCVVLAVIIWSKIKWLLLAYIVLVTALTLGSIDFILNDETFQLITNEHPNRKYKLYLYLETATLLSLLIISTSFFLKKKRPS